MLCGAASRGKAVQCNLRYRLPSDVLRLSYRTLSVHSNHPVCCFEITYTIPSCMDDVVSVVCAGFRQVSHGSTDPVVHVKAIKHQQDVVKRGDILAKIKWAQPTSSPSAAAASSSIFDSEVHKVVVRSPVDGKLLAWLVPEVKAFVPLKCPAWIPIVSSRPGVHENMGAFIRLAVVAECSHPGEFKGSCVSCG